MKKMFNQTKRPTHSSNKEDWYESLEDDYTDEDYEADEEYEGEESADAYTDEDYADEDYADEEIAEDSDELYYEEDNEAPVEEVPDEEMFEGEITYVEDESAEEYPEQEITYEDDDFYVAEYEDEVPAPRPKKKKAGAKLSVMDAVIMITGVAVLFLALVTGSAYLSNKIFQKQVSGLASVGTQLSSINMIGEKGIFAIAEATTARLTASIPDEEPEESVEEPEDYEENDYTRKINVVMNMSSIQKDLKIKFSNENTGKLVANVPFAVTVVDPNGKSMIWSDDDMDGIIYKKDITPGTYKITMEELTDSRYANYSVSTMTRTTDVKKDIAYAKVDLAGEIKNENEIDAKKEDTKKNETAVESALTDTVAWVESKSVVSVYSEFSKNQIPDPLTLLTNPIKKTAMADSVFRRAATTASVTVTPANAEIKVGESITLKATPSANCDDANAVVQNVSISKITWYMENSDSSIAMVHPDTGLVTGVKGGEAIVSYNATVSVEVAVTVEDQPAEPTPTPEATPDPTAAPEGETDSVQTVVMKTYNRDVNGSCIVKVIEDVVLTQGKLSYEKSECALAPKAEMSLAAKVTDFVKDKPLVFRVDSVEPAGIVTAVIDDSTGALKLTAGEKAGTAKVTVFANYKGISGDLDKTRAKTTLTVTVGADAKITFEKENTAVYAEVPYVLNATLETALTAPVVVAASANEGILKAKAGAVKTENGKMIVPITLEGVQAGNTNITVSLKDSETKVVYAVNVLANPKKDTKTPLTDALGNQIYVVENNDYRPAHYADYYTYDKFFVKGEEKYTGWQTIDGKVYFFTAEGKKVTGEQVIQGAKYTFASDGTLVTGTGALGIDVSKWNSTIDWSAVKNSGVNYVIIRCGYRGSTQGSLVIDPKFVTNIKGATAVGLKVGVYFFSQAVDEREAVEEASMVLEQVKNYKISYPIFLDVEPSGGRGDKIDYGTRTAVCKAFCQTIQNAGYTAGIYANKNWLETKLDPSQLSGYKIWLAQYAAAPTYGGRYDIWQYRATGKVSGISGNVDMNLSYLGY